MPTIMTEFDLSNKVVVITGATGALAGESAGYLAAQGARVACLGRSEEKLEAALARIRRRSPEAQCLGLRADITSRESLAAAREKVLERWGRIDGLLNGVGGNMPGATIGPDKSFLDLDFHAFEGVVDLNLHGTVLPTLVFAESMLRRKSGSILNFSSVAAGRALSRVVGYSAAKAAVENFTRWLAVDLARRTQGGVRVNAIVPGFFLGEQNRGLLTNPDGTLTARGEAVIRQTPFGRFGEAAELCGAIHYLLSDASRFVTGTILTVDGGFTAYSGV